VVVVVLVVVVYIKPSRKTRFFVRAGAEAVWREACVVFFLVAFFIVFLGKNSKKKKPSKEKKRKKYLGCTQKNWKLDKTLFKNRQPHSLVLSLSPQLFSSK